MPDNVQFEAPVQQTLDTSEAAAARAAAGPDIHCPYCGARNAGNAAKCTQCGGDIAAGLKRQSGQVLGAFDSTPAPDVTCPSCGAQNPGTATKCTKCGSTLTKAPAAPVAPASAPRKPTIWIILGIIALVICGLVFILTRSSKEALATVKGVEWQYTIEIDERGPVSKEAWKDQVPSSATIDRCEQKVRSTSKDPVAGAKEVCGTPYIKDTGTGQGQVVKDCYYEVSDSWCTYTIIDWKSAGKQVTSGARL